MTQIHRSAVIEYMRSTQQARVVRAHLGKLSTEAQDQIDLNLPQLIKTGGCLILSGDPGVGKSFALYYAIAAYDLYGGAFYGSRFLSARMLAEWPKTDPPLFERTMHLKALLAVDELGGEDIGANRWKLPHLDEFFDYRYRNRLPIVGATNLLPDAFKVHYGERITDRLREWGKWITIGGESLRGRLVKAGDVERTALVAGPDDPEPTPEELKRVAALKAYCAEHGCTMAQAAARMMKEFKPVEVTE